MKKVLAIVGIAVLMTSVAAAEINQSKNNSKAGVTGVGIETPGTLGSLTISGHQVGPLQFHIESSVTSQGGDGMPRQFITGGGATVTLDDIVWLYAQIYTSPWLGGCTDWSPPGSNWCGHDTTSAINTPNASLDLSFTVTVPQPETYQLFAVAYAGATWPTEDYIFGVIDDSTVIGPTGTTYIGSTQFPTPTPLGDSTPVPAMSNFGIIAMVLLVIGVAILVIGRRS
jgi:hypothetical protein